MTGQRINLGGLRRIFRHLGPELTTQKRPLVGAGVCMLGVTCMQLLAPWPLKLVFDVVLMPQEESVAELAWIDPAWLMPMIALSILTIAVFMGLLAYGQAILIASVGQKVVAKVRYRVYCHLQTLSHSFHESAETGDLLARLTGDIRMMRELLVNALVFIIDRSIAVLAMLSIMLWMQWQLALIAVAIVPLLGLVVTRFSTRIKTASRKQRRKESEVTQTLHENLSAISLVKAHARESYEAERFGRQNSSSAHAAVVGTKLQANMNRNVQLVLALGTSGVVWMGVHFVQISALTPGDLLVFTVYLAALYKPVRKLAAITARLAKATASGERIIDVLETIPDVLDRPDAISNSTFRGSITIDRVEFAYARDHWVMRGCSLSIKAGETVAITGASGTGKSTLANLLFRFYDPVRGSISIDGIDIRNYTIQSLRGQIAVVMQDALLFNTSIRDNIAYGKLAANTEEIKQAAKDSDAHAFIMALPEGYDTIVGERGSSLSGGQRQRICIARALIQNAPIVILDEPTNGLDDVSKREVQLSLQILMRSRTCLYITHDLEQASRADRVFEFTQDRLLELDKTLLGGNNLLSFGHPR